MQAQLSKSQVENFTTGYMEIDGKKLYYEMAGEGDAAVFLHAGFLAGGMWDRQWQAFSQHYRVIRYDMRGYGKSDALDGPTSRRAELYALLKHLRINAAHLIGCSLGGEVALDFALEHPEMVLGIVLVSSVPGGFEMQGEPPAELLELMDASQQRDLARMSEMQLRLWIDGPFRRPHEVDAHLRQRAAEMSLPAVRHLTWVVADMQPADPLLPPAAQQLHNIHAPTLLVAGALDNPELLRAADVMAAEIAGAQKVVIAGAAHIPSMEQPAEFNRIVLEFLGKIA